MSRGDDGSLRKGTEDEGGFRLARARRQDLEGNRDDMRRIYDKRSKVSWLDRYV